MPILAPHVTMLRWPTPIIPPLEPLCCGQFRKGAKNGHVMAETLVPHFANDQGVEKIYVGAKEFQCMGARPPFDHPHIYLDMGADSQILCPYCSTLYVHNTGLAPAQTDPDGCLVASSEVAA
jgi:uncharacterized Zn-finger protein